MSAMRIVRYTVLPLDELAADVGRTVRLGEQGACTLFLHGGRIFAVGSLCPHQNAPLDRAPVREGCAVCPRHGYRFDLMTGDCLTIGGYGLPTFPVEIENGQIVVICREWDD